MSRRPTYYTYWNHADVLNVSVFPDNFEFSGIVCKELTYPNPSLHLINFFGREGNINLT
jgi:hypothetical protein